MVETRALSHRSKLLFRLLLVALLALGLAARLLDLTDSPMDFNPSRQYRGAIIARSIYYRLSPSADPGTRALAFSLQDALPEYEPPILESLVAFSYLLTGGEHLWLARILNSLFWLIGGVVLYALARRGASKAGAALSLAFYLLLPFSVYTSRSFQPDPFMVMWLVFAMVAAHRWAEGREWKWALLTALFGAVAALVKVVAAYLLGGMMLALVLGFFGLRAALKDRQVWAVAAGMVLPPLIYYVFILGEGSSDYFTNWVLALSPLLLDPSFYILWAKRISNLIGLTAFFLGLLGFLLSKSLTRLMLFGLWLGYLLYGLSLPHQTSTHDYYHIQLVPIVALSLAPVGEALFARVAGQGKFWRALFAALMLVGLLFPVLQVRANLLEQDYRAVPAYWEKVAEALPTDGEVIGLVQQYGQYLAYYGWREIALWPPTGEQELAALRGHPEQEIAAYFAERTAGMDYFLVTSSKQIEKQPALEDLLYSSYPILAEGDGYTIFDLRRPLD